jgi:hypothetical protein
MQKTATAWGGPGEPNVIFQAVWLREIEATIGMGTKRLVMASFPLYH